MADINEVALNVLLAEGINPATAVAGSVRDEPNGPRKASRLWLWIGGLCAIVAVIAWRALSTP